VKIFVTDFVSSGLTEVRLVPRTDAISEGGFVIADF
jgi:hypothetical protein